MRPFPLFTAYVHCLCSLPLSAASIHCLHKEPEVVSPNPILQPAKGAPNRIQRYATQRRVLCDARQ